MMTSLRKQMRERGSRGWRGKGGRTTHWAARPQTPSSPALCFSLTSYGVCCSQMGGEGSWYMSLEIKRLRKNVLCVRAVIASTINRLASTPETHCLTVWRPEVQDQGVNSIGSFSGYEEGSILCLSPEADGLLPCLVFLGL